MESAQQKIKNQIEKLLALMGVSGSIAIEDREGHLYFNIRTEDSNMLIGQYGQNLNSLQHIARLLVRAENAKENPEQEETRFSVDVEDYRKNREEFLEALARKAASRVRETQQSLILKPMSSYERRVIHEKLSASDDLITESIGEGPERRVVIKLKV